MQVNMIPRLPANTFLNLMQVFKNHGWEIPDKDAGYENRFNRFCQRLSLLNADEQDLVIELTRNFTVISGNDYLQFLIGLLNRINEEQVEAHTLAEMIWETYTKSGAVQSSTAPDFIILSPLTVFSADRTEAR